MARRSTPTSDTKIPTYSSHMKNMIRFTPSRLGCLGAAVLCAGLLNGRPLLAGDAKQAIQTPAEEPIFSNWINMSLGGLIPNGNEAEFRRPLSGRPW